MTSLSNDRDPVRESPIRFVLFVDGLLLLGLAMVMILPMAVDMAHGSSEWRAFGSSIMVTGFAGGLLALINRGYRPAMNQRAGYLLTVSAWLFVGTFGTLPLFLSVEGFSFTDAYFEALSALTTTGSTIIEDLDLLSPGMLLWRSLLQWIGGIGIVVMAIVLLPALRVGGMQLFRAESSDISNKPVARLTNMAGLIAIVYLSLSALCAIAYAFAGMDGFDAINHAMTTIATGGFSTRDASIGHYDSVAIELVAIVFMTAGALPLIMYGQIFSKGGRIFIEDKQVPVFLGILLVAIVLATMWNIGANRMEVWHALRLSAFNVTSILTDTGFATDDFSAWGSFAVGLFFLLFLIGGCAGSTAGAMKIFRWQILFYAVTRHLKITISPNRVIRARYGGRVIDANMLSAVRNFFVLYILTLFGLSLLVMATGLDFVSSTSAIAQAMANAGPGLGPVVGPGTNFASIPDAAKWLIVVGMIMGRLELITVYVLLMRDFWEQ